MKVVELINKRRSKGLNQSQLATASKLSKNLIIAAENSALSPKAHPSTLRKLSRAYDVSISQLIAYARPSTLVNQEIASV